MHVVYFDATPDEGKYVEEFLVDQDVKVVEGSLDKNVKAASQAEAVSVFVTSEIRVEHLAKMPNLKMIATRSTGFDHIDIEESNRRGIIVANVPTYGDNTVAEHAFALILSLSRKVFQSYERTEEMNFDREGLEGFDLMGKTLGVIGCGNIGRHAVRIGSGFGMNVLVSDVRTDEQFAKKLECAFVTKLDDLLAQSDVITVHVPYIPESTHHLINMENIKKIKRGAVLINTARGAIVETEALLWALEEKILSGAGLDVLEEESETMDHVALLSKGFPHDQDIATILRNHILVARDDVIITPHNAFNSKEAKQRIFKTTMENIESYIKGEPINVISEKSG